MTELDQKIIETAREYQKAEKVATTKGSLDNEYAWRRRLYQLLDEKFGPTTTKEQPK